MPGIFAGSEVVSVDSRWLNRFLAQSRVVLALYLSNLRLFYQKSLVDNKDSFADLYIVAKLVAFISANFYLRCAI